jgi:ADP-heptose:LPS heptosyltransferase
MNRFVNLNPSEHHIVDYQVKALSLFGLPVHHPRMRIYIPEEAEKRVLRLLSGYQINAAKPVIAIHPGAGRPLRQWRPERFAEIADRLVAHYQANLILLGGPHEEHLLKSVEKDMRLRPSLSTTSLDLLEMAALLSKCCLFLGNDSAPGHVAAAVGCPTVSLFGPTFPHMWRPYNSRGAVLFKNVPCCGCLQKHCDRPESNCLDLIRVEEVWECVRGLLSSPARGKTV